MTETVEVKCHCGKPLHYSDPTVQHTVERICRLKGDYIVVKVLRGKAYRVQRHYIALHGLKARDLPTLGFEEA